MPLDIYREGNVYILSLTLQVIILKVFLAKRKFVA